MAKRNFPNFIEAYLEYARDNFCPDEFHLWTGISILAGALERKVSLQNEKVHYVPNFYVMLVSHAGMGKSSAIDPGVDLLEELRREHNTNFRIIPNQTTEAALVDIMKIVDRYEIPGTTISLPQSAGYFYASEASASALQNVCGDFVATMTEFYDAKKMFRKKLKGDKYVTEIECVCMNMLAGSTFDYLKNLVNTTTVMGGFASRVIYVVAKERRIRETKWAYSNELNQKVRAKLLDDLVQVNKLVGPMRPSPSFIAKWEAYQPAFDRYLISLEDPRLESLLARKATHITKLAMLLSIAESDSLTIEGEHFDRAREMIDTVTTDVRMILSSALMANKESQEGMTEFLLETVRSRGGRIKLSALKDAVLKNGNDLVKFDITFSTLVASQNLRLAGTDTVELLVDPNADL